MILMKFSHHRKKTKSQEFYYRLKCLEVCNMSRIPPFNIFADPAQMGAGSERIESIREKCSFLSTWPCNGSVAIIDIVIH